jgi:mRNA-degrading endonuclease RelE of RelBE toxin-antitoxin system
VTLLYASTFAKSLDRLSAAEQKQVKITTVDLMLDPTGNGLQLHRVEKTDGFWTARVSQDIRLVLHKEDDRTLLAYVGHHDDAYRWAERRRLVQHERTGAMQLVEIVERVEERLVQPERLADEVVVAAPAPLPVHHPFATLTNDQLLDVGVPREWLEVVRETDAASVDGLFDALPAEAAEALYDFATGGRLEDHIAVRADADADPYVHPDAQRRFRLVEDIEELRAALDAPFAQWAIFLHPHQRALVERDWSGPARVSGSAGTGKTIVALHRAGLLAHDPEARVLLTTFSKPLAANLSAKADLLLAADPAARERLTVCALDQAAYDLYAAAFGQPNLATPAQIRAAIADARDAGLGGKLTPEFLFEEWDELVDAWNVTDGDDYAAIPRPGRRTRLGAQQREAAWGVFETVRRRLAERRLITWPMLYARLTTRLAEGGALPFTHVVVDEAQDLSVAQVRFLGLVARGRPDGLFLAGDIGQRIFRLPFSWARLGLDIRGRAPTLRVNYRTSHQIRVLADRLLPTSLTDMDGLAEERGTVSVFDGPAPDILTATDANAERDAVARFLRAALSDGADRTAIGVLVRSQGQFARARAAVAAAGEDPRAEDGIVIATMHDVKGLEFRAIAVMACDEDVLPDPARLAGIGDMAELEAATETERHLLYVACTRARDRLMVSGIAPGSEFLDDMKVRG